MIGRRRFLGTLGGAAAGAVATGIAARAWYPGTSAGELLTSALPLPEPFGVPLPVPATARPSPGGLYEVTQRPAPVEIIPGIRTQVWGYDGTFPGPTFETRRGKRMTLRLRNELPVPTSTHLHGGVTPPESDGYPTDLVVPAGLDFRPPSGGHGHGMSVDPSQWKLHPAVRDYVYPLDQAAATLWYHDHRMDFTAPQVWRGLAGFLLVRDEEEDRLALPAGDREIPLMICDRAFEADGSLRYPSVDPSLLGAPGVTGTYMAGVEGDVILVNGAPWPELEVSATRHRLRFLNASNARRFRLRLSPGGRFVQIGSDCGLLHRPVEHTTFPLSPAERFDVIVDFSAFPVGSTVTLVNDLGEGPARNVMRFRVARRARDDSAVPARLTRRPPPAPRTAGLVRRTFDFRRTNQGETAAWTINGRRFRPGVPLARPRLGSTEMWRFVSDFHHPVHLHLAHFRVLARNGKEPLATDAGWKDTVDVRPYEVVDVIARFSGHRGRYMMHCHNLEHEDMAMMADFEVV